MPGNSSSVSLNAITPRLLSNGEPPFEALEGTISIEDGSKEVDASKTVDTPRYRLYKRRWAGLFALVVLNIVCAMNWVLFTAIATETSEYYTISLNEVNWLANIVCGMYVIIAPFVPWLVQKVSIRGVSLLSATLLCLGSWLRYASTAPSIISHPSSSYALLFIGSILIGTAQCMLQVVPPSYSHLWFSTTFRTTSTMLMAVANPFGGAIGDILAPAIVSKPSDMRLLMLVAAIICSAVWPVWVLVGVRPRTPPTKSAEEGQVVTVSGEMEKMAIIVGVGKRSGELTRRERIDFFILGVIFAGIVGFFDAFLTLTNQIFEPVGYDSNTAGFIGAAVIISGLVAAIITAPLFDRYFQFRLALSAKILVPIIGISFLSLIWAVKPNSLIPIYVISILLGISAFTMLPVALEMGAELTWRIAGAETSAAFLYWAANGFSVVTVVGMNALREGEDGKPPGNMHKALLFQGITVFVLAFLVFFLKGKQTRKELDVKAAQETTSNPRAISVEVVG